MQDKLRFDLDTPLNSEIDAPLEHFGTPAAKDEYEKFIIEVQPAVAVNLDKLLKVKDRTSHHLPSREVAEIWLVFHTMHVRPGEGPLESSPRGPASVAFEVDFDNSVGAKVFDVFPQTEYAETANGKVTSTIKLDANGGITIPADFSAQAQASMQACVELRFRLLTSKVISVGKDASYSGWFLYKREQPLFGEHVLAHTVWVPRGTRELTYACRVRAAAFGFKLFSSPRLPPEWKRAACDLDAEKTTVLLEYLRIRGIVVDAIPR